MEVGAETEVSKQLYYNGKPSFSRKAHTESNKNMNIHIRLRVMAAIDIE
jgi:hypothetical protein